MYASESIDNAASIGKFDQYLKRYHLIVNGHLIGCAKIKADKTPKFIAVVSQSGDYQK